MNPEKPDFITVVREIIRVVKTGGGILGKSAVLIALLIILFIVAVFRLHDDRSILIALGVMAVAFFLWYGPILWLVNKFPEKAFLEGPQWVEHRQQVMLSSKGQPSIPASSPSDSAVILVPGNTQSLGKSEQEQASQ